MPPPPSTCFHFVFFARVPAHLVNVLSEAAEQQLQTPSVRSHAPLLPRVPVPLAVPQDLEERVHRVLKELQRYLLAVLGLLHERACFGARQWNCGMLGSCVCVPTAAQGVCRETREKKGGGLGNSFLRFSAVVGNERGAYSSRYARPKFTVCLATRSLLVW